MEKDGSRVRDQEQAWREYTSRRQELMETLAKAEDALPVSVSYGAAVNDLKNKLDAVKVQDALDCYIC